MEELTSPLWFEASPALDMLALVVEVLMLELDEVELDLDEEVAADSVEAMSSVDGPPLIAAVLLRVPALLSEAVEMIIAEVEASEGLELVGLVGLMVLKLPNELSKSAVKGEVLEVAILLELSIVVVMDGSSTIAEMPSTVTANSERPTSSSSTARTSPRDPWLSLSKLAALWAT